jgi:peptide/nickel transport system substrate-binding protein
MWGGEVTWANSTLLRDYINPANGSDAPSQTQFLNFVDLPLTYANSDTGKIKPIFIKNADITYLDGISYINDQDWITAASAEEIAVPNDAIIAWDVEKAAGIYADAEYMHDAVGLATAWLATYEREKPKDRDKIARQEQVIADLQAIEDRGYLTANVKYSVTYDQSISDLIWQDGSAFSIADIVMAFITKTQLIDEESPLYDEYYAQQHAHELEGFKGFKIVSEDPLVIDYYTDSYELYTSDTIHPMWVDYGTGQQSWAMAAAAQQAIAAQKATYSKGLSDYYGYTLLDYSKGAGLDVIADELNSLRISGQIPYEELLSPYITQQNAGRNYQNILDFYAKYKHMYIGMGPYIITNIDALSPSLTLSYFENFPVAADEMVKKFK